MTRLTEDREAPIAPAGGPSLVRSGGLILLLSLLTLALAFAVQVVMAARLGTSRQMDSYLVAITLPALGAAVAQMAFPSALVPALRAAFAHGNSQLAESIFRRASALAAILGVGLAIALSLVAGPVVRLSAPGLDAAASSAAAGLLSITAFGLVFDLPRGVLTARAYARERYLAPQIAPSLNHAILLTAAVWLMPRFGLGVMAAAWALGSAAMLAILLPSAWRPASLVQNSAAAQAGLAALPAALAVAIFTQATPFVDRAIASSLSAGAIATLGYGSKILEAMMRTIPMGVVLALFPLLSHHAAQQEWPEFRKALGRGLRWVVVGGLPLMAAVVVLRREWVGLLFQRGEFDAGSTSLVAQTLLWYGLAFLPACLAYLAQHAHYALQETPSLARLAFGLLLFTLALDFLGSRALGSPGIAAAGLGVSAGAAVILFLRLSRRGLAPRRQEVAPSMGRALLAVLPMVGVLLVVASVLAGGALGGVWRGLTLVGGSGAALLVYGGALAGLRSPEWAEARLLVADGRARFLHARRSAGASRQSQGEGR